MTSNPLCTSSYRLLYEAVKRSAIRTFFDIGANEGGMTGFAADDMEIHAFEPVPDMYRKLVERLRGRPNSITNQAALSDCAMRVEGLSVFNAWTLAKPGETTLDRVPEYIGKTFDAELTTLDIYCGDRLRVGVVKLDVDGFEYRVLRGGESTIARDRPQIYCEFSYLMERLGDSVAEFLDYIVNKMNYTIASTEGNFHTSDLTQLNATFPWHTSFDVMLLPAESLDHKLPS